MSEKLYNAARFWFLIPCIIPLMVAGWALVAALVPYEPYHFYGFHDLPTHLCADKQVEIHIERQIATPHSIDRAETTGYWQSVGGGNPIGDASAVVPFPEDSLQGKRGIYTMSGIRLTPHIPGEYYIEADYYFDGDVWGYPRHQSLHIKSPHPVKVEKCS